VTQHHTAPGAQPPEPTGEPTGSVVSLAAVISAGLAAATAAVATSYLGVAGTLVGTVLTAMVTTASSAIYKAYLESPTGRPRSLPKGLQLLAALGWFSFHTSRDRRRLILSRALLSGVVASFIGIAIITAVQVAIDDSLSCSIWGTACTSGGTLSWMPVPSLPSVENPICSFIAGVRDQAYEVFPADQVNDVYNKVREVLGC
jgi:hypothetical protein